MNTLMNLCKLGLDFIKKHPKECLQGAAIGGGTFLCWKVMESGYGLDIKQGNNHFILKPEKALETTPKK